MLKRIALASLLGLLAGPALSATIPPANLGAGAAQNRTEQTQAYYQRQENTQQPQAAKNPIINAPEAGSKKANVNAGPRFELKAVKFSASHFLSPKTLQSIAAPYVGHSVHVGALRKIVADVNKRYIQRDIYTARAVLPPQKIRNGVVHIQLIEGKLGALEIKHNTYTRAGFITSRLGQTPGQVVNGAQLKRNLIFFNRTSDIQLHALLQPGAETGLTRILLLSEEPNRISIDPFIDNAGADSTGRYRGGLSFRWFDPLGMDDRFDGYFVGSRGDLSGFASYSLPVNHANGRLGVSYSRNAINIVHGPFQQLDITGHSSTVSLNFTQPLIATQRWLLTWASAGSFATSQTDAAHQKIADSTTEQLSTGLTLQQTTGHHRWSLTQTVGGLHSKETLDNQHLFFVYDMQASYLQTFGASPYSLSLNVDGQYAPAKQLPSQNLFQIGGINSVRGYEQGVIAGSSGFYGQLEFHRRLLSWLGAFVFVDGGGVYQSFPQTQYLDSTGVGLSATYRHWVSIDFSAGYPLKTVTPSQDNYRLGFRITGYWSP